MAKVEELSIVSGGPQMNDRPPLRDAIVQ